MPPATTVKQPTSPPVTLVCVSPVRIFRHLPGATGASGLAPPRSLVPFPRHCSAPMPCRACRAGTTCRSEWGWYSTVCDCRLAACPVLPAPLSLYTRLARLPLGHLQRWGVRAALPAHEPSHPRTASRYAGAPQSRVYYTFLVCSCS